MCTAYVNTGWLAHTVVVEKPSPLAQHVCPKMVAQPAYARAWLISASRPDRLLVWPNRWCTCLACCRRTKCRTYNIAFHWRLVTRAWTMSSWRHAIDGRTANKLNIMRVKPIRCVFLTDASQSQWFLSRWPRPQRRYRDIMTKFMDKIYALHTFKCTAMTNNLLHQIHKQSHCVFGYTNNNTTISLNGQVPIGRLADWPIVKATLDLQIMRAASVDYPWYFIPINHLPHPEHCINIRINEPPSCFCLPTIRNSIIIDYFFHLVAM